MCVGIVAVEVVNMELLLCRVHVLDLKTTVDVFFLVYGEVPVESSQKLV